MAKYFGVSGKRLGTVGNETYVVSKGDNVVKSKIIENNSKTAAQVLQRSRNGNMMKFYKQINGKNFLKGCFESKNKKLSASNLFSKANKGKTYSFFKEYTEDQNIIGLGKYALSRGSLGGGNFKSIYTTVIVEGEDETNVSMFVCPWELDLTAGGDKTVGDVSTAILAADNTLKEGDVINVIAVLNQGVFYNESKEHLLDLNPGYGIKVKKANFVLKKTDSTPIKNKGFWLAAGIDYKFLTLCNDTKDGYDHCMIADNSELETHVMLGLGYAGMVIARKENGVIKTFSSDFLYNKGIEDLLTKIDSNPVTLKNGWIQTAVRLLIIASYLAKKIEEIIHDWPI